MKDTIAAVATARGEGALGIVRISGPLSAKILEAVVPGTKAVSRPRRMTLGLARDPQIGAVLDEVLCFFSPGPSTATGEDTAEIHGHGGTVVLSSILDAAISSGARPAHPGEFTYRAFKNGRLDLTQAEAVMNLISARSKRAATFAVKQLAGNFGARLGREYDTLTQLAAQLEAGLDFPDEDLPLEQMESLATTLHQLVEKLEVARDSFSLGKRLTRGATVAICGPANAGKSSILNRLVDEERAIVDEEPGTTRDVIEAVWEIAGVSLTLLDTAGLRAGTQRVEKRGIAKSYEAVSQADLVLLVLDGTRGESQEDVARGLLEESGDTPVIALINKRDLDGWIPEPIGTATPSPSIGISALTGAGFDELEDAIGSRLGLEDSSEIVLTTARQHAAVSAAVDHAAGALEKLERGAEPELAATELRWARESMATLWGRNATDEVIDEIFSSFCLGK